MLFVLHSAKFVNGLPILKTWYQ